MTNKEYAAFVTTTGHREPYTWEEKRSKLDHPVYDISWDDAVTYCRWLSEATGQRYRLPSEAEWEKAARGRDGRIYPWGNQPPDARRCNFDNNVKDTTSVGSYPTGVSPYGCYDMAGNVWEWTSSRFGGYDWDKPRFRYRYRSDDGREDQDVEDSRILRGGAYYNDQGQVRCAYRSGADPWNWYNDGGYRLASGLSR